MKVHHVPCGPAVNESERKAFEQLKTRLVAEHGHDDWILLTNLTFSATPHRQSDEIDVVAIGPPGVQLIEVKHWSTTWVNRNPKLVEQEADRVTHKARKIGTTLRRHIQNLPRVDGVFLITETASKAAALEGRQAVRGVPFHTFKTWQGAVGLNSRSVLDSRQIQLLARALEPKSAVAVTGTLKRFAGYSRLELQTPSDQRFHRIYKATHTSRQDTVILHLYDLSAGTSARSAEKAEREWRSLQRLQQHGWAPRIIDSFQDAPGHPGEIKFFTVADPAAPNIEERSIDETWETAARLIFSRDAIRALAELHDSGVDGEPMVHRNLTPTTILVKHDNSPILTSFEYTRIPADVSVASLLPTTQNQVPAVSPEVCSQGRGAADHRSDIYSLCASLSILFKGGTDEVSTRTAEILALGMQRAPEERSSLSDLSAFLSDLLGEPLPGPQIPPARFWTEDQVVSFGPSHYRIVSRLGSGGVGTTFKVVKLDRKTKGDLGTYVAKTVEDKLTGRRVLYAYELAHSHLRHSALSTIFEVATQWRENNFVALMTWIDGEPIGEYTGMLELLAEDLQEASSVALAVRWLRTACSALKVLHDNGLLHGDVSPRNMIVSGSNLVLTDYDCVTRLGEKATAPGTVLYCSPSFSQDRESTPSDDIYALAASFFHIMFDREPFDYDGIQAKERGLNWRHSERSEYPVLTNFMDRSTDPDPDKRIANVAEALIELDLLQHVPSPTLDVQSTPRRHVATYPTQGSPKDENTELSERRENEVPWLKFLLQSYPGSRYGNSETRGLDTRFAEKTYVETDLEQSLLRTINERNVSLVVLCGNAGDGKTALLQHLASTFGLKVQTSATRIIEGRLENGSIVRMNLDGSASWNGHSADNLLDNFFEPFHDGQPSEDIVHLLAINDGRLLEWVENFEERRAPTQLTERLTECLSHPETSYVEHICFVNLNQRSLVGGITADGKEIKTDFLNSLVDQLYGGKDASEYWSPCRTCSAQERCEVSRANQRFGPGSLSSELVRNRARRRLFDALQAVYLRGETHITIRELRTALVYILFGLHHCTDYHRLHDQTSLSTPDTYWDRAFSPRSIGRQGDLLQELLHFDPGIEAQPQIDRRLLYGTRPLNVPNAQIPQQDLSLESLRRYAYFEWTTRQIEEVTSNTDALDLAHGRYLREFRNLGTNIDSTKRNQLLRRLCDGISRLEGLPLAAHKRAEVVPLRISSRTPIDTAFWVEKPITSFRLEADIPNIHRGLDRLHRRVLLVYRYHNKHEETLCLNADLFRLLLEVSDGYQIGDVAADDVFAHLSIFVQRLVQENHRQMLACNPMDERTIFEISIRTDRMNGTVQQRIVIDPVESRGDSRDK